MATRFFVLWGEGDFRLSVQLPALTIAAWRGKLPHSPMNCSLLDKQGIWRDVQAGEVLSLQL